MGQTTKTMETTMRVKVFQGFGEDGVQRLEAKINDWLADAGEGAVRVVRTDLAAAGGIGPAEDRYQTVIAMVWYEVK